ncbi:hypothetical protein ACHWQZ_G017888 [Mnemiopsis leidyi]
MFPGQLRMLLFVMITVGLLGITLGSSASVWTDVTRETDIPFDLEKVPLQVKAVLTNTNITLDKINIQFKDEQGARSGGIELRLSSYPTYKLILCSDWYETNTQLPAGPDMIWTFQLKAGKLSVWCDGEVVIEDISPSEEKCNSEYNSDSWNRYWSISKTVIMFSTHDTASQSYRARPPPG